MSEHERTQLGAYALGALEPHEARELDEHLATCPECRAELAELEEMKQFLGEVPPEAFLDGPPEDGDLLLQRTLREVRETTPVRKKRTPWLLLAAAVVVVAGALGGGVLIGRQTVGEPDEPTAGYKQEGRSRRQPLRWRCAGPDRPGEVSGDQDGSGSARGDHHDLSRLQCTRGWGV